MKEGNIVTAKINYSFTSYRDGDDEVYVKKMNGSEAKNLSTFPPADDVGPSWPPCAS